MHGLVRELGRRHRRTAVLLATACIVGTPLGASAQAACSGLCTANHTFVAPSHTLSLTPSDLRAGSGDAAGANGQLLAYPSSVPAGTSALSIFGPDGHLQSLLFDTGANTGPVTVEYVLTDGAHYGTGTLTIIPGHGQPAAQDQFVTASANTPLNVAPDGMLTGATDLPGVAVRVVSADNGKHGTVSWKADGSFTYIPESGFVGRDSFTFTIADGVTSSTPYGVDMAHGRVTVDVRDVSRGGKPGGGAKDGAGATVNSGPAALNPPAGLAATPELDSLILFGGGLTGLGAYALRRWRTHRTRR